MKLNYYVLWKKDNEIISNYLDKYYLLLVTYLEKLKENWILIEQIEKLLKIYNRDFILNPDQSSIINLLYKEIIEKSPQYLWDVKIFELNLQEEINIFLNEWIDSENLISNKWRCIAWTNIKLTVLDNNPYNIMEDHPDHAKMDAISWSWWEKTEEEWLNIYEKTFNLLYILDKWIYSELNQIIHKIVPLWTARGMHNSASYKECVWHLYMWYTIDSNKAEINNLEAIIHESSHNKLNLIMQFDPIVLNDKTLKYYSAIRPDARHIHGIFLGYHAFAPTMYIIMKAYLDWYLRDDKAWLEKIVLYYIKTKFLQKIIKKYAILTDLWKEISEEIDYVILQMDILFKKINPSKEIILKAKEKQNEHFSDVNKNYPYLEY
jgi:hypothetical protein